MKVNEIGAPHGAHKKTKRRGRGSGSGHGKTSCRGHKGARARSGVTTRPGFEGGQMPLIRRLPKRGFNALFNEHMQVVNVQSLNRFEKNAAVGPQELKSAGLVASAKRPVKILGDGNLTKALTVKAHAFSESAKKKIESIGAVCQYLREPVKKRRYFPKKKPVPVEAPKAQKPEKAKAPDKDKARKPEKPQAPEKTQAPEKAQKPEKPQAPDRDGSSEKNDSPEKA